MDRQTPWTDIRVTSVGIKLHNCCANSARRSGRLHYILDPEPKFNLPFWPGFTEYFHPPRHPWAYEPAALWLSGDYAYLDLAHNGNGEERHITETPAGEMEEPKRATATATALILPLSPTNSHIPELTTSDKCRVHSTHSAIGLLYRVWWFLSISGLLSGAGVSASRILWGNLPSFRYVSLTHLLENCMYFVLSAAAVLITCTYILLGRTHSTVIPCIHETWYKILTVFLAAMGFATMIVAVLETRQLYDGTLSTLPEFQCNQTSGLCVPVARGHGNYNT
jgi:hypothetical protein